MMYSEASLAQNIQMFCRDFGLLRYHALRSEGSTPGWPDEAIIAGRTLFILELKRPEGRITPAQQVWLDALDRVDTLVTGACRPGDWPGYQDMMIAATRKDRQ